MKPCLIAIGVGVSWLCAAQVATAQFSPIQKSDEDLALMPGPAPWLAPKEWGTLPPPRPLPYGYRWDEYRGADIEHPLYAPRHGAHLNRTAGPANPLSALCCWFDKLFQKPCVQDTGSCQACQNSHVPLPPVPTYAPPALSSPPPQAFNLEPVPVPVADGSQPTPEANEPSVSSPANPPVIVADEPSPQPPVAVSETHPAPLVVPDPPTPITPGPAVSPPIVSTPAAPAPSAATSPAPVPTTPEPTTIVDVTPPPVTPTAPDNADARPLPSDRTPIVELAPEIPVPTESASPPRNAIPPAPSTPPRNAIPRQKRSIFPGL